MTNTGPRPFWVRVVQNFWREAPAARERFEALASSPYDDALSSQRQCWDYWHVTDQYCYLRTLPKNIIGEDLVDAFTATLSRYCDLHLPGLRPKPPWLTLHTNDMRLDLHHDRKNGAYAYVLSLTPEPHRFSGGQTMVMKSNIVADTPPEAGYFHIVAPRFNQLLLFDSGAPHMVSAVHGGPDPLAGRLCLTGHIA